MATGARTGDGGAGSGGAGTGSSGGEARASAWVLRQPDFSTRTIARVESSTRALAGRWAPEGRAARRSPALKCLGFADRMIAGYLGGGLWPESTTGEASAGRDGSEQGQPDAAERDDRAGRPPGLSAAVNRRRRGRAATPRALPQVDWLFPTPWYQDEIGWLAAARAATRESELAAARGAEAAGRARTGSGGVELPLELVAPGLAPAGPGRGAALALGAYSPLIDARAARTAEFLARLSAPALAPRAPAQAADAPDEGAASIGPAFTYVSSDQPDAPRAAALVSASPAARAVELLAAGDRLAPSAGPRVILPAGLGGVAAAAQISPGQAPAARPAGPRAAQPLSVATSRRPAAVDHLVWSDRWLARFSGASAPTLRSFDAARTGPWQPSWVAPARAAGAGSQQAGAARALSAPALVPAPVLDDDEPVSDSVLSAIAAAAAGDRPHARQVARTRQGPPSPRAPSGPFLPPRADRQLARVAAAASPGLGAHLGASPAAALLSGLVDVTAQPTFDPRQLAAGQVADLLRPAAAGGPALAELAARAPGAVWLERAAQPGPGAAAAGQRPGDLGSGAQAFAHRRTLGASDSVARLRVARGPDGRAQPRLRSARGRPGSAPGRGRPTRARQPGVAG